MILIMIISHDLGERKKRERGVTESSDFDHQASR